LDYVNGLSVAVSEIDIDDFSYDTMTTRYKSSFHVAKKTAMGAIKAAKTVCGNTSIGMPFVIDTWRDSKGSTRVSVQLQLLSGNDMYTKVFARISTNQKELIINLPMSQYMSCSDDAFRTFLLDEKPQMSASEKECLLLVLQHHPKTAAHMQAVSKIRGQSNTEDFFYEQRISLPRACEHSFATEIDVDKFFHGTIPL
jgi:hypothetical protein